jgi:hypothetical protein
LGVEMLLHDGMADAVVTSDAAHGLG